ncbi:MAG: hypothetical protein PWP04_561 [Candidatus Atribacteria bacterium]|nr:hypothetical protein [Candidatus Atribacteria bacterium]
MNNQINSFYWTLFLISVATLAIEGVLLRLFTFVVGYHFVSLIVSLALLGYGAAGSLAFSIPDRVKQKIPWLFAGAAIILALGFSLLPLDGYQFWVFPLNWLYFIVLLVLAFFPFFFHGLYQLYCFELFPALFPRFYGLNLIGSAGGTALGFVILFLLPEIKAIIILSLLPFFAVLFTKEKILTFLLIIGGLILLFLPLDIYLSPYSPSQTILQDPSNKLLFSFRHPAQILQVFDTPHTRVATGVSVNFEQAPPTSWTLVWDHHQEELFPQDPSSAFIQNTLFFFPFQLISPQTVLILESKGGLETYCSAFSQTDEALYLISSPLFERFLEKSFPSFPTEVKISFPRKFLAQTENRYQLITAQVPVGPGEIFPGAFSLEENYLFTQEGIRQAFSRLEEEGYLALYLFLQQPPSVLPKVLKLLEFALEEEIALEQNLLILKALNFSLVLLKKSPLTLSEIEQATKLAKDYQFDWIYYPGIQEETAENIFQTGKIYYQAVQSLLKSSADPKNYPFNLKPPQDNSPYFSNFFTWSQLQETWTNLGKRWLPFGGAGFLLVIFTLVVIVLLAVLFILLPSRKNHPSIKKSGATLIAGASIGAGYMFLEIPLIVKLKLTLGYPLTSFLLVLGVLLTFSGLGSLRVNKALSPAFPRRMAVCHPLSLIGYFIFLEIGKDWLLLLSAYLNFAIALAPLALVAYFSGMPLAYLSQIIRRTNPAHFPQVFAWNGFFSVISSLLAHLLSVFIGISTAYFLAVLLYCGYWLGMNFYSGENSCRTRGTNRTSPKL